MGGARDSVVIREAQPEECEVAALLAYMAMGDEIADYLLGLGDAERAKRVMAELFSREGNRFSYAFSKVAIQEERVVGLLIAYPGRQMPRLLLSTGWQMKRMYSGLETIRFLGRAALFSRVKEAKKDEYHISSLAVLSQCRGRGIGTLLLAHAENRARAEGLSKCSLAVKIGNDGAVRLYRKQGYVLEGTYETKRLARLIGYKGVHRMLKTVL